MNKLIKEIVSKCSVQEWTSVHGASMRFNPGDVDKFAQLLLKEFITAANTHHYPHFGHEREEYEERFTKSMKEYFGVKE
jgi:hypothetical protein